MTTRRHGSPPDQQAWACAASRSGCARTPDLLSCLFEDRGGERLPGCSHHDRFLRDGRRSQCACACCGLFATTSVSFLLNAGMSSGLRLVMMLPSSTTSLSTHFAPALMRSVWMDGHEV